MKNGRPILWQDLARVPVRIVLIFLLFCGSLFTPKIARAQCTSPGYNQTVLNWDILDYLVMSGWYDDDNYITNTIAYTQWFAFGPNNRLTIAVNSTNVVLGGEIPDHTGNLANYTGDDVMFTVDNSTTRTITLTFENPVENPNFVIYDIERSQQLTISATNELSAATAVNIATQSGSILTVAGSGTPRTVTANSSTTSNSSNAGSATISVPGLVRSITIAITTAGTDSREIYLSDIRACVNGSFPLNYYAVAQPFTGQPGYVLHAFNRSVYYVNPANGFTRWLFTDPGGAGIPGGNINSLAYDPYNRYIYYVFSLTGSGGSIGGATMMRRYDVNTGNITTMAANLETIGLPTTDNYGTESGSAAFYNGSYYIGVETSGNNRNSGREAVIWRIDFNGTGFPSRCSQVFAQPVDSAELLLHDWSDFVIYDGTLYNFDAAENDVREPDDCGGPSNCPDYTPAERNQSDIYHVNMMTGDYVRYSKPGLSSVPMWYPGQPAINWAGQVVQMYANAGTANFTGAMPASLPYVTTYNGAGGIGAPNFFFSLPAFTPANPSLGDAAEAFKPRSDFGDAPSSYDNDPMNPATHEFDPLLRLGSNRNIEWSRTASSLADAEVGEEDAIGGAPQLFTDASMSYTINNISFLNNTGAPVTLIAWLDYNLDGQFDASEGRSVTINTNSASLQTTSITWTNIWVPLTTDLRTFLRFRIARASDNMTVNNFNGWVAHGEVEDYPVGLGAPLPKDIQSFDAKKKNNAVVDVQWSINVQQPVKNFEILRSTDDNNWIAISTVSARDGMGMQNYSYTDINPAPGKSHYRVRVVYVAEGANKLSETRMVQFTNNVFVRILPNPAHEQAEVQVYATGKGDADVRVYDRIGRIVLNVKQSIETGMNSVRLNNLNKLAEGVYTVRTVVNGRTTSNQLVIKKQ